MRDYLVSSFFSILAQVVISIILWFLLPVAFDMLRAGGMTMVVAILSIALITFGLLIFDIFLSLINLIKAMSSGLWYYILTELIIVIFLVFEIVWFAI